MTLYICFDGKNHLDNNNNICVLDCYLADSCDGMIRLLFLKGFKDWLIDRCMFLVQSAAVPVVGVVPVRGRDIGAYIPCRQSMFEE